MKKAKQIYRTHREKPASSSLFRSTTVMTLGTLISRITGFGRILVIAPVLGGDRLADTYNLANNVPNIIYEMVIGGVLAATLVPVFVNRLQSRSTEDAWEGISATITAAAVLLIVATVGVVIAAPWIIHLYTIRNIDSPVELGEQRALATLLLRLFAPQIAFYGFISLATGLLNAHRRFAAPMFAPIFNNVILVTMLLALAHMSHGHLTVAGIRHDHVGLLLLGLGTTAGVLGMALVVLPPFVAVAKGKLHWYWKPRHETVRTVVRLSGWTAGFVAANQLSWWVMTTLADGVKGSLTSLIYSYQLFIVPHGIFTVSVMSALQPRLAGQWTKRDFSGFRSQVSFGLRLVLAVLIPLTIGYILLAQPMVREVMQHGTFRTKDAHSLADVLALMVLGLPGFSAFIFITRAFQSMQEARSVFILYAIENGVNVLTAPVLYHQSGVRGLAVSQSISYSLAAVVALWALRRKTQGIEGRALLSNFFRVTIASAGMLVIMIVVAHVLKNNTVAELVGAILTGALTYIVLARLLGITELGMLLRFRRRSANAG